MIQNQRAYQLIHCHTRSRLLAGAAAVCGAACGHADLGLYHLLHRGGAPLPDSTQADRAALAALCPKPAAEETCPLLPQQAVFRLCCALYAKTLPQEGALPRRARWGARALRQQDFGLWCRYGRRFQLL